MKGLAMNLATTLSFDVLTLCATALAGIAMFLLWRGRRLRRELRRIHSLCEHERQGREMAEQALIATRAQLAQALARQDRVQASERQRIGRDLHDDLGQHLLALTMEICATAAAHPRLKQPLARIDGQLRMAIRSLRTVIKDLLPEALEHGMRAAVETQLAQFTRISGIRCRLDADPAAYSATQDRRFQAMLYRILQETLSNIARHAQATQVEIALCRQDATLSLTVRDNGIGLPAARPGGAQLRRGCGLDGIEQRVAAAGGQFHVSSRPGQGTALSMSFPLDIVLHQACESPAPAQ